MRKSSRTSDLDFASMDGKDIQNGGSQFYEGPFEKNHGTMFYFTSHAKMVILGNRSALCNKSGLTVGDQGSTPTTDSGTRIPGWRP